MWLRNLLGLMLVVFLAACEEPRLPSPFHASDVSFRFEQADFSLTDHHGKPRTLAEFVRRGALVSLIVGFVVFGALLVIYRKQREVARRKSLRELLPIVVVVVCVVLLVSYYGISTLMNELNTSALRREPWIASRKRW